MCVFYQNIESLNNTCLVTGALGSQIVLWGEEYLSDSCFLSDILSQLFINQNRNKNTKVTMQENTNVEKNRYKCQKSFSLYLAGLADSSLVGSSRRREGRSPVGLRMEYHLEECNHL